MVGTDLGVKAMLFNCQDLVLSDEGQGSYSI